MLPLFRVLFIYFFIFLNQTTGYASQHIWCLSEARINWDGCGRKDVWHKDGRDDGGVSLISPDGVASSQIVSASACVVFRCTIKSIRISLALAHLGSTGKMAVKWLCVCVCV